ncbi:F0F1 ATP synthase subunit B [Bartonella ancashensis]|uniref:ATP synthase subunit b n=1 Tax=Bartonella ancashensis TaxID=1318743 RepID=A0A0M4L7U8_9HYPH|nr:F0F1 ATP synthase subunit B [Bartonella ancashensis]ALE04083.1 ATP synthase B' chain [Bartonella ancashensis]
MFVSTACARAVEASMGYAEKTQQHADRVFPPFDLSYFCSHFFWLVLSFGLFYIFISRVIVPRIGGIIETRQGRIASDLDQAMRMKQEADSIVEMYEKKLTEARLQAHLVTQKMSNEIKEKSELERKEIRENLERSLVDAENRIAEMRDEAVQHIDSIAGEIVPEIVKKLMDADVSRGSVNSAIKAVAH